MRRLRPRQGFAPATIAAVSRCAVAVCVMIALANPVAATAAGQEAPPTTQPQPPADKPASLDELLGIDKEQNDKGAADAAAREAQDELKRRLNEAEMADSFALAVQKMAISAELLDSRFDAGLGTQRVQEDIIAKLAQLIDMAKKNQMRSQSSSSSSSSSQQQQQANQQQQQQRPGQQKNQSQPSNSQKRNNRSANSREGDPPALQEGNLNTVLEESRSEWGSLPPRLRDALQQGSRDKFSSLYHQLTAEYYKRLAEESRP